jgi:hypothetical protein
MVSSRPVTVTTISTASAVKDEVHHRERHCKNRAALAGQLQIVETAHPFAFGCALVADQGDGDLRLENLIAPLVR